MQQSNLQNSRFGLEDLISQMADKLAHTIAML